MKTRNNLRAYCIVALLAISSLVLMGAAGGQQSAGEQRFQEIMNGYRADGMMANQRLSTQEAEAILKDGSLKRYESATPSKLPVTWPASAEFSYIYEVNHLIVRGDTMLEVVAPGATPYGYAVEAYVLTKHALSPAENTYQPSEPKPLYGEYGIPLEKVTFKVAPSSQAHPVYFVTKWKAAKVSSRMSWPSPVEIAPLKLQPRQLPKAEVIQTAEAVWNRESSPTGFLQQYPAISRYKTPTEAAVLEQGKITGQCGSHAQVILLLAQDVGVPAMYISYTAHWSRYNEGHAFTALWDGSAWVNNPFPWERGNHEIGPVLGRSMVGSRPGSPQTTIANKGTVVPVR